MFDFLKSKPGSLQERINAVEAVVRRTRTHWDHADVRDRTELLKHAVVIHDDQLFLAYVNSPWSRLPQDVALKLTNCLMNKKSRERLLSLVGTKVSECTALLFSAPEFQRFFGQQSWAKDWSHEDGLGVWFALGRFCQLIAIGSAGLRQEDERALIHSSQEMLISRWSMVSSTWTAFERFNEHKLKSAFLLYRSADNGRKTSTLFSLFVSEIVGNDVSFSLPKSSDWALEKLLEGNAMVFDPVLVSQVSGRFRETKELLRDYVEKNGLILLSSQL